MMEKDPEFISARNSFIRNRITEELLNSEYTNSEFSEKEKEFLRLAAQLEDSWAETTSTLYSSKLIKHALDDHASALVMSANAADKNANGLRIATWVLASATIILAIATVALWLATTGK